MVKQHADCSWAALPGRPRHLQVKQTAPFGTMRRSAAGGMGCLLGLQPMGHTVAAGHIRHSVPAWQRLLLMQAYAA